MVRAFAHGAMGCWIDPAWWTHWAISRSRHCPMTGVTKAVVCIILSVGYKRTLAANRRVAHVAAASFLFHYLSDSLLYI